MRRNGRERAGRSHPFIGPLAALCLLGGCTQDDTSQRTVSVYNWADFIGKHTLEDFEKSTGIKVDYETFDADATVEAKMLAGGSGYDVVETSTLLFSRQIKAGAYLTLDHNRLPGLKNIDSKVLELYARFDPGNAHAVPYLHSLNGFAYNVKMIRERMPDAPVHSLRMIFDPEIASRFADCGITFVDSSRDVLQLALVYLGIEPDGTVFLVTHRSEMGTGIRTTLPLVAADELDAAWSRVRIEQAAVQRASGVVDLVTLA